MKDGVRFSGSTYLVASATSDPDAIFDVNETAIEIRTIGSRKSEIALVGKMLEWPPRLRGHSLTDRAAPLSVTSLNSSSIAFITTNSLKG